MIEGIIVYESNKYPSICLQNMTTNIIYYIHRTMDYLWQPTTCINLLELQAQIALAQI
jgi:hypothetical protein